MSLRWCRTSHTRRSQLAPCLLQHELQGSKDIMQMMSAPPRAPADDALDALAAGTSDDPFALLGPHRVTADGRPALLIRTLQPSASEVQLVTRDRVYGMQRRGHVFEAKVPLDGAPEDFHYWFRLREGSVTRDTGDPY